MYAVRYRLPRDIAEKVGLREIARSLSTADPGLARRRAIVITVGVREIWEAMRAMNDKPVTRERIERGLDRLIAKMATNSSQVVEVTDNFSQRQLAELEFGPIAQELAAKA
jgi:Glu-tRNA(Gln) amidotransferase subunit E-like FAD-binding protein